MVCEYEPIWNSLTDSDNSANTTSDGTNLKDVNTF